jgi:hypothetical protein
MLPKINRLSKERQKLILRTFRKLSAPPKIANSLEKLMFLHPTVIIYINYDILLR